MTSADTGGFSVEQLAALPIFAGIDRQSLDLLLKAAEVRAYAGGSRLFEQGDEAENLHLLLSGKVGLYRREGTQGEAVVEVVPPGGIFVAAAVLTGQPLLMSAVALGEATVLHIPASAVLTYLNSNGFARALLLSLAEHYRTHVQEITSLADALESRLFPKNGEAGQG